MACRDSVVVTPLAQPTHSPEEPVNAFPEIEALFFGVSSAAPAVEQLQHNLSMLEWVCRNKIDPNFWGRYIGGSNSLTKEEAVFIHQMGCKIAPIFNGYDESQMTEQTSGAADAAKAVEAAKELGIKYDTILFLQIPEAFSPSSEYLLGYAKELLQSGFFPGFYGNTDAKDFDFSHQFSRAYQMNSEVFSQCEIWATSPTLPDFNGTTYAHFLHPDIWKPHSPSCITRDRIAIWQYGTKCHPVYNDENTLTSFNLNLVKDVETLTEKLF